MKNLRLICLALLMAAAFSFCSSSVWAQTDQETMQEYNELITDSVQLIQSESYDEAKDVLNQAIEVLPNESVAYYNLACIFSLEDNSKEAIAWLEEAVARGFVDVHHMKTDGDLDNIRDHEAYKAIIEKYTPKTLVHVPDDYDDSNTYPVMVFLHGAMSNPEDVMKPLKKAIGDDFIIICPPAGRIMRPNAYIWDLQRDTSSIPNEVEYQLGKYSVDRDRVYLGGFSLGGTFSYLVGMQNPELFTGIIPCGGALDGRLISKEDAQKAKGIPIFIIHGESDEVIPVSQAKNAKKALTSMDYRVKLHLFDGGHTFPTKFNSVIKEAISFLSEESGEPEVTEPTQTDEDDDDGEDF